ncbi:MAG TPA: tautomerase family protein [Candidatus Mediterraneibacter faecipullorum]|uniref:Tautomerase family protein n=1 Tax=Candidatus Mediterraneibacter faecipullorum TaxID=2838670 RepID=A0A9D2NNW5_9FIRM|nr:tautomerase family protein [Candidatus Mediterraneibacter faecipullorum]
MPHVNIKCYPGKTEEQKRKLAEKITEDIMEIMEAGEEGISIVIEEIPEEKWENIVWKKEISNKREMLYKAPGYSFE